MGKKVKEYKSGDFIFAKVKGYPAWPARVQRLNGKKYFVYFYGTGETANLPPNMIFDYAENKDKFLTKTVKRRDFNDGVKQIEHDFANNVPLEDVIGVPVEGGAEGANDTGNDTMEDSAMDTTAADDTVADTTVGNTTQNDTTVEDSDDAGALVIDEGKQQATQKGRKSTTKTPAKEPAKPVKTPGRKKKEDKEEEEKETEKEEIVSRSGRKIRPKRYIDEQTEENATLPSPSPAPKKRRASPAGEKEKATTQKEKEREKGIKHFNSVSQSELEDLKEPFKSADSEKENILIAYLPSGQYVGIKLFQSRPTSFKNDAARLQWDTRAAANAVTLKQQLERGHITAESILAQLVMDLNLTDEEKASLDKERETEEKKSRVQFLKTEMKLIELDARIKTCLCLEKADTELCLKLIDELMELDIKPLMLLKHPTCLETVKRMRAYVGNTPSWDLTPAQADTFSKQATHIRKQADVLYNNIKKLFTVPSGLSFWEWFSERVLQLKKCTADLSADQLLEMVHEPSEMSMPTSHTMQSAIELVNEEMPPLEEEDLIDDPPATPAKKKAPGKPKKAPTPAKSATPAKRQSSRNQNDTNKDKVTEKNNDKSAQKQTDKTTDKADSETTKEPENNTEEVETTEKVDSKTDKESKSDKSESKSDKAESKSDKKANKTGKQAKNAEKSDKSKETQPEKTAEKESEQTENDAEQNNKEDTPANKEQKEQEIQENAQEKEKSVEKEVTTKETNEKSQENGDKEDAGNEKDSNEVVNEANEKNKESGDKGKEKDSEKKEAEKEKEDEPRAKRSRGENKKTEAPPPRSPAKRKSKA